MSDDTVKPLTDEQLANIAAYCKALHSEASFDRRIAFELLSKTVQQLLATIAARDAVIKEFEQHELEEQEKLRWGEGIR